MKTALLMGMVAIVIALHQDFWNWTNKSLIFGYVPVGLAYHGFYSCLAAATVAVLVRFAWPSHLEEEAERPLFNDVSTHPKETEKATAAR